MDNLVQFDKIKQIINKNNEKGFVVILDASYKKHKIYEVEDETEIIEFLQAKFPDGFDFFPTFYKNDKEILVKNLDEKINKGDIISIFATPKMGIVVSIVVSIVVNVVVSYVMKLLFPAKKMRDASGDYAYGSIYSSNTKQIEAKKNGPVPYISGVIRFYPQLIAPAFTLFSLRMPTLNSIKNDNGEDTYLLCCLGSGEIDVLQLYINNTQVEAL